MSSRLAELCRHRAQAVDLIVGLAPKAGVTSPYRARAGWLIEGLAARVERIDAEIAALMAEERERMAMEQDRREVAALAGGRVVVIEEEAA